MSNIKKSLLATAECPHCQKPIEIFKETKTLSPAVKAEKEEIYTVSKGVQTKLDKC